jgi:hypothetical protein
MKRATLLTEDELAAIAAREAAKLHAGHHQSLHRQAMSRDARAVELSRVPGPARRAATRGRLPSPTGARPLGGIQVKIVLMFRKLAR